MHPEAASGWPRPETQTRHRLARHALPLPTSRLRRQPVRGSRHTSPPPGHLSGWGLLTPIFQTGRLRQRGVESVVQVAPGQQWGSQGPDQTGPPPLDRHAVNHRAPLPPGAPPTHQPDQPLSGPTQRSGTPLPVGRLACSPRKPTARQPARGGRGTLKSAHAGPRWACTEARPGPGGEGARGRGRGRPAVATGSAPRVTLPSSSRPPPPRPRPPATAPRIPLSHSTNVSCSPTMCRPLSSHGAARKMLSSPGAGAGRQREGARAAGGGEGPTEGCPRPAVTALPKPGGSQIPFLSWQGSY